MLTGSLNSTLHEPEAKRLEKQVEALVSKFEKERKKSQFLDEQIKAAQKRLGRSKSPLESKETSEVSNLEKQLEFAKKQHSRQKIHNRDLRNQIDNLRKEILGYRNSVKTMKEQLEGTKEKSVENQEKIAKCQNQKERLSFTRSKSLTRTFNFRRRMTQKATVLSKFMKEDKLNKSSILRQTYNNFKTNKPVRLVHSSKLTKTLESKWREKTLQQKQNLDSYLKQVRFLKKAFKEIKYATGTSSPQEIADAFIKSTEQQSSITVYLNELLAKAETLEAKLNRKAQTPTQTLHEPKHLEQINQLSSYIEKNSTLTKELMKAKDKAEEMLKLCYKTPIELSFSDRVQFEDDQDDQDDHLSEKDLTEYLGQIEEFIRKMKIVQNKKTVPKAPEKPVKRTIIDVRNT